MTSNEVFKRRLQEATALCARYWMSGLRMRFRPTSLDDLARQLEPNLSWHGKFEKAPYRSNKYRAYDKGERSPRSSLVTKIDAIRHPNRSGEGSKAEFEHVLWEILQGQPPTPQTCRRWLQSLSIEVQAVAQKAPAHLAGRESSHWIPVLRPLEFGLLRHRPGLDALALLTFVVQQAHRFGQDKLAHQAGHQVVQMLWQLSAHLDDRGLLIPFMEMFERWVLPATQLGGIRLALGGNIVPRSELLRFALKVRMSVNKEAGGKSAEGTELRRILRWAPRSDLFFVYAARYIPVSGFVLTEQEQRQCGQPQTTLEKQLLLPEAVSMLAASRNQRTGSGAGLE
ncbi:hypothetical protein J2W27_004052 [Variovorax boronicumulans]|uniref:hypothetical protein n=1 Tax=Variovorax boronicumulans TaxID=436515 RepID=UPI00277E1272|nr:hypothetical protein [Variovorax boronicumulans]MDP9911928.1 hypothetical protein [Variovorax boronicumulans]